jgi:cellulose synthase operon protein C
MIFERVLVSGVILSGLSIAAIAQISNPDFPVPNTTGAPRPSFLPQPQPRLSRPALTPGEGEQPRMIRTIVELPVPEPVAEAPEEVKPDPTPGATPKGAGVIFGQQNQSKSEAQKPVEQQTESSHDQQTAKPAVQDQGKPGVIFGEENPPRKQAPQPSPAKRTPKMVAPSQTPAPGEQTEEPDPQALLKQKRFAEVEPIALDQQDDGLAKALGWGYYNSHRYARATKWFKKAIEWNEDDYESAYGLALSLTREGDYDKAEEVARWRLDQYPSMRKVLGDILSARAVAAYQGKEYRGSLRLFTDVENYRVLSRDEQIVQAWDYFQAGDYTLAAQEFERLYVTKPDKYTASGVYASYARLKNWARIEELSKTYDGALLKLYQSALAQRYYDHRLYANAYATDPQKYPELSSYTSPAISSTGFARFKSGVEGTSKLTEVRGDATGIFYQSDINRFAIDVGLSSLNSGNLSQGAFVGQAPLVVPRTFLFSPRTTYNSLVDFRLGYQRLGFYTPSVELGISPVGGALDPTLVGKAGLTGVQDWGNWEVNTYRNSVKQSILSYTGLRDPYTGNTWGRVSEDGLSLSAYDNLEGGWGVYGQFGASILEGESVETNSHITLALSVNRQFDSPNFTYFSVGPSFSFEHYAQNQDFFTFGQGGYFSPDYLFQGAVALRFMTKEARPYLIRGDVGVGLQTYKENSAPIFPLENSAAMYPETTTETFVATARLAGLVLVTSQLALGASVEYSKTGNYSEFIAAAFLRFFFEPRTGLFGTDF